MIGVIIHEVGHNFFPMIINSDERQWSWMDEGLNTFVEYLTEELWDNKFPSRRVPAHTIVNHMKLPKDQLEPITTNSENIIHFNRDAYAKPATGLNILRETIMGRELLTKLSKHILKDGRSDILNLQIYSERWKMLLVRNLRLVLERMVLQHRCCRHSYRQSYIGNSRF